MANTFLQLSLKTDNNFIFKLGEMICLFVILVQKNRFFDDQEHMYCYCNCTEVRVISVALLIMQNLLTCHLFTFLCFI